jgi:serine protease
LLALRRGLVSAQQMDRRLGKAALKSGAISAPDVRARWETLMTIKSLRKDPRVRFAEPNYLVKALAVPDDEAYPLQWHYPLIGLPDAWETTTGDPEVVVAVVDTGILADHPDLAGQLVDGYDFVRDPDSALDGDGIDPDPEDAAGNSGSASESFHGTHVSGTIAARGNNLLGVAGSAYSSRVMPLRVLGAGGGGTSYDVDQAVRYAAGLPNDSGGLPQKPADIINLSLGGAPFSQATQALYDQVRAAGVMVVAAAGNQASSAPTYPAAYENVISVSAVDAQRRLAAYSNTGPQVDVTAPGGDNSVDLNGDGYPDGILSTSGRVSDGGVNFVYSFLNGTSMAAPHVAGVLALMKSVNPALTPADIDALLAAGELSDDLGPAGRDNQFGHGIINAQRAVFAALEASGNSPADNPRLVASSSALSFGSNSTTLSLILRNGGKGDLQLSGVSASEPWLQVAALNVDAAGLGEYVVSVDRSGLAAGIYTADIIARSSVNNLAVQVLVSVGSPDTGTDVGVIYILLYDPLLDETVAQFASGGNGTSYPYRFTDVPAGVYEIVAGTDADNDLVICDAGEACGAWLTIDQPILFEADSDLAELDFPVEYLVSLPNSSNTGGLAGPQAKSRVVAEDRSVVKGRTLAF